MSIYLLCLLFIGSTNIAVLRLITFVFLWMLYPSLAVLVWHISSVMFIEYFFHFYVLLFFPRHRNGFWYIRLQVSILSSNDHIHYNHGMLESSHFTSFPSITMIKYLNVVSFWFLHWFAHGRQGQVLQIPSTLFEVRLSPWRKKAIKRKAEPIFKIV